MFNRLLSGQQRLPGSHSSGRQEARVLQRQLRQLQRAGGAQRYDAFFVFAIDCMNVNVNVPGTVKQQLKDWEKQEKKLRELKAKG